MARAPLTLFFDVCVWGGWGGFSFFWVVEGGCVRRLC